MLERSLITTPASDFAAQADSDAQVVELWIHGRSHQTQRAYRSSVGRFLAYTLKSLRQIALGDVQAWSSSMTCIADSSRGQRLAAIKSLLAFARKIGYTRFNVGAAAHLPKVKNSLAERILRESEVHRMFALETNPRNQLILRTLYYGGLRVSELCGLRWRDLQSRGEEGQMTVFGKGGKTRAVLLPASLWTDLEGLRGGNDVDEPVFRSRKAGRLDESHVLRIVKAASIRAGSAKNVSPHWLRHGLASHSLDRGAPITSDSWPLQRCHDRPIPSRPTD